MTDLTTQARAQTPIARFKEQLNSFVDGGEVPLPSNVPAEAFRNAALVAATDNPKVLGCDRASVFSALRTLAAAGLVPDGREAALVPFRTKMPDGSYGDKCQAMPMVFGLVKMVRRSGQVTDIRAHIVYQNEVDQERFVYKTGDEEVLTHDPILFGERGDPVGVYAIATLRDGQKVREFMSANDVDKVRRAGSSQKIFEKGKRPTTSDAPLGIWLEWSEEMWKKSVIRRLCKRLDMSSEDMRRVMVDQDDITAMRDVTPEPAANGFAARATAAREGADAAPSEVSQSADADDGAAPPPEDEEGIVVGRFRFSEVELNSEPTPMDEGWGAGMEAARDGVKLEDCPEDDRIVALGWAGGWLEEQKQEGGS
mgnify:CR=1 FL=1